MINVTLKSGAQNAHQRFSQRINDRLLSFEVDYVSYTEKHYWVMNVYQDGTPIALGMPLNSGAILMANHNLGKDFGQFVFVGDEATIDNLGVSNKLVWIPSE